MSTLAVQMIRVITGCGSHGFGKSKLKQSVRYNPPPSIQIFYEYLLCWKFRLHYGPLRP